MEDRRETDGSELLVKLSTALALISKGDPIVSLRTELATQFNAIQTRFEAIDKATELQHDDYVRVPTQVEKAIDALRGEITPRLDAIEHSADLVREILSAEFRGAIDTMSKVSDEKFSSISIQFAERDTRTEQTAAGVKIAVDAALQAAKEAVAEQNRSFALATGKSETATMKQIDALGLAIQTANKGLDDKIADMKDRLTRIEGMDLSSDRYRSGRHGENQNIIAIVAIIVGILLAGVGWFGHQAAPVDYAIRRPTMSTAPVGAVFYYLKG
jgi:hypothetical protein